MVVKIKDKNQITLPSELAKLMHLSKGDYLNIEEQNGKIIITPVEVINREVLNDVKSAINDYKKNKNNYRKFEKVEDLLSELDK
jgi:AbrB family looped-hinge helix DNA binding protein